MRTPPNSYKKLHSMVEHLKENNLVYGNSDERMRRSSKRLRKASYFFREALNDFCVSSSNTCIAMDELVDEMVTTA